MDRDNWNGISHPGDSFAAKQRGELLAEALKTLTREELCVVSLHAKGTAVRAIGELLSLSHVTVLSIEIAALSKMRTFFADRGVTELADIL
jgi:DNA-binding NarL/FixJ family response regulator